MRAADPSMPDPDATTTTEDMAPEPARPFVEGVHLQRTDENVREIDALAAVLGPAAGLDALLDDLKYAVRPARFPRLLGRAVREAYRWDDHDERDELWYPQGISTSADASDTEDVGGRRVLVTTWYSTGKDGIKRGSRITFVDLDTGAYRHVLLVVPVFDKAGNLMLRPMNIHAGGIVWAGPNLHIAATNRGFVTARVDDIMRVPGDDDHPDEIGVEGNTIYSFGHRYVLPGALHLPGLHRRGPREAALLLHVPRPALGPAGARRRRVRPRPEGHHPSGALPARPGDVAAADRGGRLLPAADRSTRVASSRCRAP